MTGVTVTADCQACLVGVPLIRTPAGKPDNPIGTCKNCGSLTCGQHGYRDPKPEFVCIQCDQALQAGVAAAYWQWQLGIQPGSPTQPPDPGSAGAPEDVADTARAARAAAALRELLPPGWRGQFTTFGEWAERRSYYRELADLIIARLDEVVRRLDRAARLYAEEAGFDDVHRVRPGPSSRIRAGAGAVAAEPPDLTISPWDFSAFWRQLDRDGQQLLAASFALAIVMFLPAWSLPPQLRSIAQIARIRLPQDFPDRGGGSPLEEQGSDD